MDPLIGGRRPLKKNCHINSKKNATQATKKLPRQQKKLPHQ